MVDLNDIDTEEAEKRTVEAMNAGADVIVQAVLREGRWLGKPDVLRKVAVASNLGDWSYEVYDTKLALETPRRRWHRRSSPVKWIVECVPSSPQWHPEPRYRLPLVSLRLVQRS